MNFFSNKKILIAGGTGHLGSAIVHSLVNKMKVPPGMIRIFYLAKSPTASLTDISGLEFFEGNILNPGEVKAACEGVQLVFHTIGSTTFDPRQKKLQWLINVHGTRNMLDACLESGTVEKICYTSTINALAVPNPVGGAGNFENCNPYSNKPRLHSFRSKEEVMKFIDETFKPNAPDWENRIGIGYHDSKLAAQELVNKYAAGKRLNIVSILPGTMFGPYDYLVGTGMYLLSLYQNKMPVVLRGGLPLTHVMDVAGGQLLAMEKAASGSQYILTGLAEDNRTFKEMGGIIVEVLREKFPGKKFKTPRIAVPYWLAIAAAFASETYARLFNQPMLLSLDAVRAGGYPYYYTYKNAALDLGYEPKRTFREAVSDMVDYYVQEKMMETKTRFIDKR